MGSQPRIHATADVSADANIGQGTSVWNNAQIREGVEIGQNCNVGTGVYIDFGVKIGDNVKIQNGAQLFHGLVVGSGVFIGPGVIFVNDKYPRAVDPDGNLLTDDDWELGHSVVSDGASIGAGAIINFGVKLGAYSMVAAGSVVTRPVPDYGLVVGSPARLRGFSCGCGRRLVDGVQAGNRIELNCECGRTTMLDHETWLSAQ